MLETKELGANVGRVWKLEKAMRWREVVRTFSVIHRGQGPKLMSLHLVQRGPTGEMTGLYKSRGAAVEALIGAVYSREVSLESLTLGGRCRLTRFDTHRVLPHRTSCSKRWSCRILCFQQDWRELCRVRHQCHRHPQEKELVPH